MAKFQSTKLFDGFSCVFRQWKAEGTHCKFLHGYGVSFRVWFEGELDERNWVFDFGGMKRAKGNIDGKNPKEWMDYMFDHTTIVATDDPGIGGFRTMNFGQGDMSSIVGRTAIAEKMGYGDLARGPQPTGLGVQTGVAELDKALNRDYSGLMKAMDKKKGPWRPGME